MFTTTTDPQHLQGKQLQAYRGCSCLEPVCTLHYRTYLSDLGSSAYQMFDHAVVLEQVMRQEQILIHKILFNLKNGEVTKEDCPLPISYGRSCSGAQCYTTLYQPIATIKAVPSFA